MKGFLSKVQRATNGKPETGDAKSPEGKLAARGESSTPRADIALPKKEKRLINI